MTDPFLVLAYLKDGVVNLIKDECITARFPTDPQYLSVIIVYLFPQLPVLRSSGLVAVSPASDFALIL